MLYMLFVFSVIQGDILVVKNKCVYKLKISGKQEY